MSYSLIIPPFTSSIGGGFNVAPGGYDNLGNWPSSENRPVFIGSTLSWTGPIGGGPSTTTDVRQARTLSASGSISSSSDGQIIEGKNISGNVTITHNNVTLRQCRILWQSGFEQINIVGTATGCLVEDCEIDGANTTGGSGAGSLEGMGLTLVSATVRRCNFHNMANAISDSLTNSAIVDCWIHALSGTDNDGIEFNDVCSNSSVTHCTFDWTGSLGFTNSGVNITNVSGGVTGIAITNCRFMNFVNFGICDGDVSSSGETFSCVNCGFFNNNLYRNDSRTCSPNASNYNMASPNATSGSLVNGTGQI